VAGYLSVGFTGIPCLLTPKPRIAKSVKSPKDWAVPPNLVDYDGARAAFSRAEARREAMTRSQREIPHYYLLTQIDRSRGLAWLAAMSSDIALHGSGRPRRRI
jgi:hypothetical protein